MPENTPKQKSWFAKHKVITAVIGLFIFVSLINGISTGGKGIQSTDTASTIQSNTTNLNQSNAQIANNTTQQQAPAQQTLAVVMPIKISSTDLYNAYQNNEVGAGEKYQDKVVQIHGSIATIGKDIIGSVYVGLTTPNPIGTIECMVADSDTSKVANLNKGQNLTVTGTVNGYALGNIVLNNCTIQ